MNKLKIIWTISCLVLGLLISSCNSESGDIQSQLHAFSFSNIVDVGSATRATDALFENGDRIGVYAVKRNGDNVSTLLASGNFADNKQYVYQDGNFVPVTDEDVIYPAAGEKTDFYAYYPYSSTTDPTALVMNANVDQSSSGYHLSDYLWCRAEGGYITAHNPVNLIFSHIMGKVEVVVNKGGVSVSSGGFLSYLSQKGNLQTGVLQITSSVKESVNMQLESENSSQYVFRALVPHGNVMSSGAEISFATSDGIKKFVANKSYNIISGTTNHFVMDVITWNYTFSVNKTFLGFASGGETKSLTITSTRNKVVNGVPTAYIEPVSYTANITGANASAFSASDNSITALDNPTTDFRDAVVTYTQSTSGRSISVTVEQDGKIDIGTEI